MKTMPWGLLWADEKANLMDPQSWHKLKEPVLQSCFEHKVYGPGHNSFTVSADGKTDLLVYHARTYTEIVGDPLWDPNRHTYVKALRWDDQRHAGIWPPFFTGVISGSESLALT